MLEKVSLYFLVQTNLQRKWFPGLNGYTQLTHLTDTAMICQMKYTEVLPKGCHSSFDVIKRITSIMMLSLSRISGSLNASAAQTALYLGQKQPWQVRSLISEKGKNVAGCFPSVVAYHHKQTGCSDSSCPTETAVTRPWVSWWVSTLPLWSPKASQPSLLWGVRNGKLSHGINEIGNHRVDWLKLAQFSESLGTQKL